GMPVRDSDLDHTKDAAFGGPTSDDNLSALCRRHHVLKHHTPWHVTQLDDGLLEWSSPTGHVYIDKPPPQNTLTFTEDGAAESRARGGITEDDHGRDPWATVPEELLAPF
ncbi:MAG: HNH endonuclease signature motif containing protein, partial [Microbacterium sp.]